MNPLGTWADYFLAQVSASAALTGLMFVVLSFSFDQIVGDIVLLGRAGAGLALLAQPAIYGLIALFPTRTSRPVAWTLAAAALAATAVLAGIVLATTEPTPGRRPRELPSRLSFVLAGCLATTAGGLALAAGWTGGTFVLAAGALTSLAIGLVIAWFLLVEVRRATTRKRPVGPASNQGPPTGYWRTGHRVAAGGATPGGSRRQLPGLAQSATA